MCKAEQSSIQNRSATMFRQLTNQADTGQSEMQDRVRHALDAAEKRKLKKQLLATAAEARDTSDQMMQGEADDRNDEYESGFFNKQQEDGADDYAVNDQVDPYNYFLNMTADEYVTTQPNNQM